MRKDILLALLAASVTGTAFANANLGTMLAGGNWTVDGLIGDGQNDATDIVAPDLLCNSATRTISGLAKGTYIVSWTSATNAAITINGKAVVAADVAAGKTEVALAADGSLTIVVAAASKSVNGGGFDLMGLGLVLKYDFNTIYTAVTATKNWTSLDAVALTAVDSRATAQVAAVAALQKEIDDLKTVVNNLSSTADIYANYTSYVKYNILAKKDADINAAIAAVLAKVAPTNEATKKANDDWATFDNNNADNATVLAGYKEQIDEFGDPDAADTTEIGDLIKAAKAAYDTLAAKVNQGTKYTDAQVAPVKAAIKAVEDAQLAYDDQNAAGDIDTLRTQLEEAVTAEKEQAFKLVPVLQNAAIEEIDKLNAEALEYFDEDHDSETLKNKAEITAKITEIGGVVESWADMQDAVVDLYTQLDEATALGGDDFNKCNVNKVDALKAEVAKIEKAIKTYARAKDTTAPTTTINEAITAYEGYVNQAVVDLTKYNANKELVQGLRDKLADVKTTIEDNDEELKDDGFAVGTRFNNSYNNVVEAISKLQGDVNTNYNNCKALTSSVTDFTGNDLLKNIGTSIDQFDAYVTQVYNAVFTLAKNKTNYQALCTEVTKLVDAMDAYAGTTAKATQQGKVAALQDDIDKMNVQNIPTDLEGQEFYQAVLDITYPDMATELTNTLIVAQKAIAEANRTALTTGINKDKTAVAAITPADKDTNTITTFLNGLNVNKITNTTETSITIDFDYEGVVKVPADTADPKSEDEYYEDLGDYVASQLTSFVTLNEANNDALATLTTQLQSADAAVAAVTAYKTLYNAGSETLDPIPAKVTALLTWLGEQTTISDNAKSEIFTPYLKGLYTEEDKLASDLSKLSSADVKTKAISATNTAEKLVVAEDYMNDLNDLKKAIDALNTKVTGAKANINTTQSWYQKLANETIAVNDEAQGYMDSLKAEDPSDVTGLQADIQGYVDELLGYNNDIYNAYKGLFPNADGTAVCDNSVKDAIAAGIADLQKKIQNAYNSYGDNKMWADANNKALEESGWSEALADMNKAYSIATQTYDAYKNIKNEAWAAAVEALDLSLNDYHKYIYNKYDGIVAVKNQVTDAYVAAMAAHKVVDTKVIAVYVTTAKGIASGLNTEASTLNTQVNDAAKTFYENVLKQAQTNISTVKSALTNAGIVENANPTTEAEKILNNAYVSILTTPETIVESAKEAYKIATTNGDLGAKLDNILMVIGLQSVADGIDANAKLADAWTGLIADLMTSVDEGGDIYKGFHKYNQAQLQDEYDALVEKVSDLAADNAVLIAANAFNATAFDAAITGTDGYVDLKSAFATLVQKAKDAAGDEQANAGLYAQWQQNLAAINTAFDALKADVNALGCASTQASNLKAIQTQIDNQSATVDKKNEAIALTAADINTDAIQKDINKEKADAYAAEKTFLNTLVMNLYKSFNYFKVKSEEAGFNNTTGKTVDDWYEVIDELASTISGLPVYGAEGAATNAQFIAWEKDICDYQVTLDVAAGQGNPAVAVVKALEAKYTVVSDLVNAQNTYDAIEEANHLPVEESLKAVYGLKLEALQEKLDAVKAAWEADGNKVIADENNFKAQMNDIVVEYKTVKKELTTANKNYAANEKAYEPVKEAYDGLADALKVVQDLQAQYVGGNGYLSTSKTEWAAALETLSTSIGNINTTLGKDYADQKFATVVTLPADYNTNIAAQWKALGVDAITMATTERDYLVNGTSVEAADGVYALQAEAKKVVEDLVANNVELYQQDLVADLAAADAALEALAGVIYNPGYPAYTGTTPLEAGQYNFAAAQLLDEKVIQPLVEVRNMYLQILSASKDYVFEKGDLNADGVVDLFDALLLRDVILDDALAAALTDVEKVYYDVNGNGKITIADLTSLISIITKLEAEEDATAVTAARLAGKNVMSLTSMGNNNGVYTYSVDLRNAAAVAGLQFDLVLEEGVELVSETIGDRASALKLYSHDNANGRHRIILTSDEINAAEGNEGAVVTFQVKGTGMVSVENAYGADLKGREYVIDTTAGVSGIGTVIGDVDLEGAEFYNVNGQRVDRLQKGVNIIRKADGTVVKTYNK